MSDQEFAAPMDMLLTQAALGTVRRFIPDSSALRALAAVVQDPAPTAAKGVELARELTRVVAGTSQFAPSSRDPRFRDEAWTGNPVLRRIVQAYLAGATTASAIVNDLPLEWQDAERVRFLVQNLIDALAPSNNPLTSPVAWKAVIDTGGGSVIAGLRHLVADLSSAPRVPSMVDQSAFTVGEDLAASPGSVVLRTEMFELIQYAPTTETVYDVPLLIIPPTINKFYALDLAPGRSLIEYLVGQGHQVFILSWRNPDARHAGWGFDEYATAIFEAFNAVASITGANSAHTVAACSGGLLGAITAAHRAAAGGNLDRLASLSLLVTMIDQSHAGTVGAIADERTARMAVAASRRRGYLDGRQLAEVFAWLRPNDLIWNYWINNYLQGRTPPKFDILYWNADTTRMTARLHADFVDVALGNKLAHPGGITVLGTEIDLSKIVVDSYVVAGSADHICPWTNCYRSTQLLGGKVRFVLSTNGHIAALVNPPGNPKSSYLVSEDNGLDPGEWKASATREQGSWWPDYSRWLADRSGGRKQAPSELGDHDHPPIEASPGSYVRDS